MKKTRIYKAAVLVLTLLIAAGILAACGSGVDSAITNNISELTTNIFAGNSENIEVTLTTGEREAPYAVDGVSSARSPYTIVSIKPLSQGSDQTAYDYVIKADKNEYRGKLNLHPFGITFTDTISKKTSGTVSITVSRGEYTEEISLNPQHNANMISWETALETGINCIRSEVSSLYQGKKLNGEVYVRFTGDPMNESPDYFWYIAVVGNNGKTYAALINPLSGEVVAAKKI